MPACFKETCEVADVDKVRGELLEAYLSNQIPKIEATVEKAAGMAHEGHLEKVIEACRNRIEKLQLSQPATAT